MARWQRLAECPVNASRPQGWLLEFLRRQRDGLTGHPDVLSYPFNTCLWGGVIKREGENHGANWWRYEQTAYYSDGLLRLGFLLGDSGMIGKGEDGIQYTLAHERPDGRLGPDPGASQWPMAVYFRALEAAWQATKDTRIIQALHRHYLTLDPAELGMAKRNIVNVEGILWTYGHTGDERLLQLAERAYAMRGFELSITNCLSPDKVVLHGVTYMEMAKLPAILYMYTGKRVYLDAAENAFRKLDRDHMLPDGVPSSNEFLAGKDPLQSHETCDISDYSWSLGYLLMATGDAGWADRIERAVFNAGPGAVSKDFHNLQYFSSVNQVIATGNSNQNAFQHGSTWMAYWPCHETECCAGNVHRFMPNYAARMWMRDMAGGVVAALYGPSELQLPSMRVTETTSYPFGEEILFSFDPAKPVDMPFTFRVPGWCGHASLEVNGQPYKGRLAPGTFVTLRRTFRKGDRLLLRVPMQVRMRRWGQWGGLVERGPLLYAYPVPEKVRVDTAVYANLLGKHSPDKAFPALDIRPAGRWNYTLAVDEKDAASLIKVVQTGRTGYPLDEGGGPLALSVPVRRVKDWTLVDGRYTPPLPLRGQFTLEGDTERVLLAPYGSTRLRVSVFPLAGDAEGVGADAGGRAGAGGKEGARRPADTTAGWKFGNFGDRAGGSLAVAKDSMTITTQNTPHAFFESDGYSFAYQARPFPYDDCSKETVSVTISRISIGSAGIMIRGDIRPDAPNVHMEAGPSGDVLLFWRKGRGQMTSYTHVGNNLPFPVTLRLVRQGEVFTAWYRDAKGAWTKGPSAMAALGAKPVVGFYACSGMESQIGYSAAANPRAEVSFSGWDLHYEGHFIPAEKNYTDTMPVKAGTLLRDNFNDGSLSNGPATATNPVWSGITYGYLPYDKAGGRYWRKTGDGIFYLGDKKWADYRVGVDLAFDRDSRKGSECMLQLRYQNISIYAKMARYYGVGVRDGNRLFFEKYESGAVVFSKTVPIPDYFNGSRHRLEVRLLDRQYEVYYDGRKLIAGTDTVRAITYGNIALKFTDAAVDVDNLEVVRVDDPVNGEADNYLQDYYDTPLPDYLKQYGIKTTEHE